ncbi:MAG: roadblock/LC7 domain-containing protein [Candidatus Lokiarchaeota archaeon]|nr:roadblock/LC7 domain-containing protein [Candidatus Lokiarchaeota archaeon]
MQTTIGSLDRLLKDLIVLIPKIKTALIVSRDGLTVASLLPKNINDAQMALVSATMVNMALKAIKEINAGEFELLTISATEQNLIALETGKNAVLVLFAEKDINPRKIFLESKKIRKNSLRTSVRF